MYRSKGLAFFLNLIPGLGHFYAGKKGKGIVYGLLFFGLLGLGFMAGIVAHDEGPFILLGFIAMLVGFISMVDMLVYLINTPHILSAYGLQMMQWEGMNGAGPMSMGMMPESRNERFFTILLSFIPGLGHFYLGLMQRGLSFLMAFFGLSTVLIFTAAITRQEGVFIFLGLLPIIWLYCMFDAVQSVHRKRRGEILEDRTLFDDYDAFREVGRRSKMLAMVLSVLPGAGHMYLGLQKRGLQLMVAFFGAIYVFDFLRLSFFFFVIPLIWCFSFFDALQQISRSGREMLFDVPIVKSTGTHKRLLGSVLVGLGGYYLLVRLVLPVLEYQFAISVHLRYQIEEYLQTIIIAIVLIGGGLRLLFRSSPRDSSSGLSLDERPYPTVDSFVHPSSMSAAQPVPAYDRHESKKQSHTSMVQSSAPFEKEASITEATSKTASESSPKPKTKGKPPEGHSSSAEEIKPDYQG